MNAGKLLIVSGAFLIAAGIILQLGGRVPWIGRLPGDIVIRREGFTFYFPVTSCILLSLVLSFVIRFLFRK